MAPAPTCRIKYERYTVDERGECFADTQVEHFDSVVEFLNSNFRARLEPDADLAAILAVLEPYTGQILECDFGNPDVPGTVYQFRAHNQ
jgi:hypothetical protein